MLEPIAQPIDSIPSERAYAAPARPGVGRVPNYARNTLDGLLDTLATQLGREDPPAVVGVAAQRTLAAIADVLRDESESMANDDYRRVLERLVAIYAPGTSRRGCSAFLAAAPSYANVLEIICRGCPTCDYDDAVGQMLVFMNRLFRARNASWRSIYQTILAIPDSAHAKQFLLTAYFPRLQEWHDSGVANLFSIEDDLKQEIGDLGAKVARFDRAITRANRELEDARPTLPGKRQTTVVSLDSRRRQFAVAELMRKRQTMLEKLRVSQTIVELIESDIQEFEGFIRETRRAYFIRRA